MLVGHQPKDFLLAVEALTVSFDGFKAVNDLSFYVEENEIRVIIGPNGAGKTTVLDLICGKTRATSGSIQFRGKDFKIAGADNPLRKDAAGMPKHVAAGGEIYIRNCVYCHGDNLDGKGHFAHGFNPPPAALPPARSACCKGS